MISRLFKSLLYLLIVFSLTFFLTELALSVPQVRAFIQRPEHYKAEIPYPQGLDLPAQAEQSFKLFLQEQKRLEGQGNVGFSESTIKNEPSSPLAYSKGSSRDLGGKPIRSVKTENSSGRVIYDVQYNFDSLRRRVTLPNVDGPKNQSTIAMVGCSFIFGMGVNDSETIPSQVQELVGHKYKVHNLGIIAGGANDFLEDVYTGRRIKDFNKEAGGVAVYSYFSIHRERTFCLADCYREEWRRRVYLNNPAWEISDNFSVSRTGTVVGVRSPLENFLRQMFYNTKVGLFSQIFYSAELPHYKKSYISYLKALEKQWAERGFKFVVFLLDTPDTPWTEEDIKILESNSINFIYFKRTELFSEVSEKGVIPGDDHFNSVGNRFRALQIVEGLKQKGLLQ